MIKASKFSFLSREEIILLCSRPSEKMISNTGVEFSHSHAVRYKVRNGFWFIAEAILMPPNLM